MVGSALKKKLSKVKKIWRRHFKWMVRKWWYLSMDLNNEARIRTLRSFRLGIFKEK